MSCGRDVVFTPLRAFVPFLLETEIRFGPVCSIGSAYPKPRTGHGLGQKVKHYPTVLIGGDAIIKENQCDNGAMRQRLCTTS